MDNDSWIITAERYTKCKPTKPGHLSASISGPQDQTKFSQGHISNQIQNRSQTTKRCDSEELLSPTPQSTRTNIKKN